MNMSTEPHSSVFVSFEEAFEKAKIAASKISNIRSAQEEARRKAEETEHAKRTAPPKRKIVTDMIVPGSRIGLVVGNQGEHLKKIERATNVHIQLDSNYQRNRRERKITLTGAADDIEKAKDMIRDRLDDLPIGFRSNGTCVYVTIPTTKVGLVIGKRGETIHQLQSKSGAKVAIVAADENSTSTRTVAIVGGESQIAKAKELLNDVVNSVAGSIKLTGKNAVTIKIPESSVSVIIGKKGEFLKQIQATSNAQVYVEPNPEGDERSVYIAGEPDEIAFAQELIASKVGASEGYGDQGSYDFVAPTEASTTQAQYFQPSETTEQSYSYEQYAQYYEHYYQNQDAGQQAINGHNEYHIDWNNPEHVAYYAQYYQNQTEDTQKE